jgi:hypothetical protein
LQCSAIYIKDFDRVDGIFGCDAQEEDEPFSRWEDNNVVVTIAILCGKTESAIVLTRRSEFEKGDGSEVYWQCQLAIDA